MGFENQGEDNLSSKLSNINLGTYTKLKYNTNIHIFTCVLLTFY